MKRFKNTSSYKYGVVCGYIYILTGIILCVYLKLTEAGVLKTTGYWGIFEHQDTIFITLFVFSMLVISLIAIPNIGLVIFLNETLKEDIIQKTGDENQIIEIINFISFILYAWLTVMFLLAGVFAPPNIPLIILLVYFVFRIIKAKKNV